ncbi:hypothetical protein SAMN05518682_2580 [Cellulosimicrobium aquatile]|uniref:Uncharacterized protein n=1 Tax=Cellulosimicrobium aquatile TaxID=1612203 RepID=A0A1N6SYG9_9MICO|nr:hypothetical protein SAMN05518682_2580 [Cellulosimicrobium aquatile]
MPRAPARVASRRTAGSPGHHQSARSRCSTARPVAQPTALQRDRPERARSSEQAPVRSAPRTSSPAGAVASPPGASTRPAAPTPPAAPASSAASSIGNPALSLVPPHSGSPRCPHRSGIQRSRPPTASTATSLLHLPGHIVRSRHRPRVDIDRPEPDPGQVRVPNSLSRISGAAEEHRARAVQVRSDEPLQRLAASRLRVVLHLPDDTSPFKVDAPVGTGRSSPHVDESPASKCSRRDLLRGLPIAGATMLRGGKLESGPRQRRPEALTELHGGNPLRARLGPWGTAQFIAPSEQDLRIDGHSPVRRSSEHFPQRGEVLVEPRDPVQHVEQVGPEVGPARANALGDACQLA